MQAINQDQSVAMVPAEQTQAAISAMLSGEKESVQIAVETHEEAHRELARRTNLDKGVILQTLFGFNKFGMVDPRQKTSLPVLFGRYFKGLINDVFTEGDLSKLADLLAKEKEDAPFLLDVSGIRVKVRKGNYADKTPYLIRRVQIDAKEQILIGASRPDCAVYFLFTNEKSDVNNGVIYVRNGSTGVLRRVNTFEINPFVKGRGLVTDPETGATEIKDQLTFNPSWLTQTVDNMERYVFAPLVYVPPRPKLLKKQKGVSEVDMGALIEKTLNPEQVKVDGEKMAEEVRTGIEAYRDKALAEIAKRDGVTGAHDTLTAQCLNANQLAQCDIGKGATLDPELVALFDKPVQDSSYVEAVLASAKD